MTQENKELLLKDLCGRLSYGVKVLCLRDFNHEWYNLEMIDIGDNEVYLTTNEPSYTNRYAEIETVKPYLFPMSSMTEEQKAELDKAIYEDGKEAMNAIRNNDKMFHTPWRATDWLNKNHFDYRGLIPMGLAIDATGLNIY